MATTSTITGSTRMTIVGLVVAAIGVLIINVFRADEVVFSLVVATVLLLAAGAAWRLGVAGHIVAGVVGLLLLLLFGGYTVANISGSDDGTAAYNETAALVIDGALAVAGAVTVYGAVTYLLQRRRSRHTIQV